QLVSEGSTEIVPQVPVAVTALEAEVRYRNRFDVSRLFVNQVTVGIRHLIVHPSGKALHQRGLQGMINRIHTRLLKEHTAVLRPAPAKIHRTVAGYSLIEVRALREACCLRTDVGDRALHTERQLSLDGNVPLLNVGDPEIRIDSKPVNSLRVGIGSAEW